MRTIPSSTLSTILFGQTRSAVLALLYGHPDESFYLRQIAREKGISPGAVQRELEQLSLAGLVTRSSLGNQVFYQANSSSPVFAEIRSLIAKTVGAIDVLRSALSNVAHQIRVAFVYGSIARQEETATSDVDLMIIGDVLLEEVIETLSQAKATLAREINPITYSVREFRAKVSSGNHFLNSVVKEKKLFIVGTENELRKLGTKRVA